MARAPDPAAAPPDVPVGLRLGALLLVLAAHAPALRGGFCWDDEDFYELNAGIRSLRGIPGFFSAPFPPGDPGRGLYRPLTQTSYAVDWAVGPGSPFVPHATNLALYAALCVGVWALLRTLLRSPRVAFVVAVLFGLHPVHTEVVDSIAGRSELLALGLSVAAMLAFLRFVRGGGANAYALCAASLVLATFAKESAVVLPGVLALTALLYGDGDTLAARARRAASWTGPFFLWVPIYVGLRAHALGQLTPTVTILGDAGPLRWISTVGAVAAEYTRLFLLPTVLEIDAYYQVVHPGIVDQPTVASVAGWAVVAAVGFAGVAATWRAARHGEAALAPVALGLGIAAAFFFPVSHLIPFGALMAERFLFAPSLGLLLAVGAAWERAAARRPGVGGAGWRVGLALIALAFAVRTTVRAQRWENDATLWRPLIEIMPNDARAYNNVAKGLIAAEDYAGAMPYLSRALTLNPDFAKALQNRGHVRLALGDIAGAQADYERAVALLPKSPVILTGLGAVYNRQLRHREAEALYERALAVDPNYATALENLASTRAAITKARAWIEAHPEARAPDAPPALQATLRAACTVVGDVACVAALPGPGE